MKLLAPFLIGSALLSFSALASAQVNAVYVVDVKGLDAARVREGVARELHGDAVAPEDPRAKDAVGRVVIETKDGKATVTYRKVGAPVTRSVDLPEDPARAESTAILLTGNLARDEAGELLDGLKKPSPPPAKPAAPKAAAEPVDLEERDHAAIRAIFRQYDEDVRHSKAVMGWTAVGAGVILAVPATYFLATSDRSSEAKGIASVLTGVGVAALGGGIATLLLQPEEEIVPKMEREGATIGEIEAKWEKEAEDRRSARRSLGIGAIIAGLGTMASGATLVVAMGPHKDDYGPSGLLFGIGGYVTIVGILDVVTESHLEASWRTWKALHAPPPAPKPLVGFSPMPGGAYGTVGFTF